MRRIAIAVLGVVVAGCGFAGRTGDSVVPAGTPGHRAAPVTSDTTHARRPVYRRPFRLVKPPVILVALGFEGGAPDGYTVAFRLNRGLPPGKNAVRVSLGGASAYNTSGHGYDGAVKPHCYWWLYGGGTLGRTAPAALRHPHAGVPITVRLRFLVPPYNTITTKAGPQLALPSDGSGDGIGDARLRRLGCRP
jgi:hypothetical protein